MSDEEHKPEKTVTGQLTFEPLFEGSKSERVGPVLVTTSGERVRVFVLGDNPFENQTLRPLEGQQLEVSGKVRRGVLCDNAEQLSQRTEDTGDSPEEPQ